MTGSIPGFDADVFWWEPDGRVMPLSPRNGLYFMSCVHPSGTHAVFWGGSTGRPRLWVGDGSGTLDAITDTSAAARYPAYSADGATLAFCRSHHPTETMRVLQSGKSTIPHPTARMSIVVRAEDGTWERQLTDGRFLDQRPALSPDGSRVVFVSNRRMPYELWTVGTDGGDPSPLAPGLRAYRPWWSVDGRSIYFFTVGRHRRRLHSIPAAGGRPRPFTNDDRGRTHGPFADPAGRSVIAHSTRGWRPGGGRRTWQLYEFPLDGTPPMRVAPPGHHQSAHGTRARNGVITFDVSRPR